MSTRRCEFCERDIPIAAALCPHCAKPQASPAAAPRQILLAGLAVALAIAILVGWHVLWAR